jgi:hypothetical protein
MQTQNVLVHPDTVPELMQLKADLQQCDRVCAEAEAQFERARATIREAPESIEALTAEVDLPGLRARLAQAKLAAHAARQAWTDAREPAWATYRAALQAEARKRFARFIEHLRGAFAAHQHVRALDPFLRQAGVEPPPQFEALLPEGPRFQSALTPFLQVARDTGYDAAWRAPYERDEAACAVLGAGGNS